MSLIDPSTGQPFVHNGSNPFAPATLESFPPLTREEFLQMKEMASKSVSEGHNPATPVAMPLQAMAQIVRMIDILEESIDSLSKGIDGAKHHVTRQSLHGKHAQDKKDADDWLAKWSYLWDPGSDVPPDNFQTSGIGEVENGNG